MLIYLYIHESIRNVNYKDATITIHCRMLFNINTSGK